MSVSDPINALRDNAPHVAARLRLLAHADHLAMLCRMTVGEVSVSGLVDLTRLAQSGVSQHLAMLREADAVAARALAQVRHYHIVEPRCFPGLSEAVTLAHRTWFPRLAVVSGSLITAFASGRFVWENAAAIEHLMDEVRPVSTAMTRKGRDR